MIFDSQKIKHQVLPTFRDRYALTQWFVSNDLAFDEKPPIGLRFSCSKQERVKKRKSQTLPEKMPKWGFQADCFGFSFEPDNDFSFSSKENPLRS